jgi:hypothetical protein
MPRHTIRRATSGVATLGTVIAVVVVGLTSTSATAAPGCRPGYPASVATTTRISAPVFARVGHRVVARASVSSRAGKPSGSIVLRAPGATATGSAARGVSVSFRVNRRGTYRISASYGGSGCYKASSAGRRITVFGRGGHDNQAHFSRLSASSVHRGGHPSVSGRIVRANGRAATGRVRVRISHGQVRYSRTVGLHRGRFHASFPSVRRVGTWTASATGGGTRASTTFRVRR